MAAQQKRVPTLRKKQIYEDVTELIGKAPGKEVWKDEELLGRESIALTILNDDDMIREVKILIYGLTVDMTPRAIAGALNLTWNMRSADPIESRIFPERDAGTDIADKGVAEFEENGETYISAEIDEIVDNVSGFEARRAGAFLAASTLKMFAKDVSSWNKAWDNNHIQKRYADFCKKPFPFGDIMIKEESVMDMYEAYQGQKIFLGTLGRILYALAEVKDTRQTEMLFEQHLSCTGLHIVPQFISAKMSLGASTGDLLSALDMKQNEPTLLQLRNLIDSSLSKPVSTENRGTWRFARLFDQSAFSLLQTKYCQDTVAILAHINDMSKASNKISNPLDIAVLKQMGSRRMTQARAVARNIHHYFTVTAKVRVKKR